MTEDEAAELALDGITGLAAILSKVPDPTLQIGSGIALALIAGVRALVKSVGSQEAIARINALAERDLALTDEQFAEDDAALLWKIRDAINARERLPKP